MRQILEQEQEQEQNGTERRQQASDITCISGDASTSPAAQT